MPDYNKIMFSEMPPIPLEEIVPDASPTVSVGTDNCFIVTKIGTGVAKEILSIPIKTESFCS